MEGVQMQTIQWGYCEEIETLSAGTAGTSVLPVGLREGEGDSYGVLADEQVFLSVPEESAEQMNDATAMLAAIEKGDHAAAEELLVLVYDELRRLAASKLAQEAPGQTLQATALVHEAWLRLVGDQARSFKDRTHFFRASAEAMRRILIDRARRKKTQRHGGAFERVDFDCIDFEMPAPSADDELLAMNEALEKLAHAHPVQADLVKLRYFAGLTNEEVSEVMGISVSTVKNYWGFSRAWLLNEMESH
jgi:RNA polymerase sigma factor (TIGR02999 family)